MSIRFQTLPSGQVEVSVEEHKRYEHNDLIPGQLQTLAQAFPEKFINYFQELALESTEHSAARGKNRRHIEELIEIYQDNLHHLEVRVARQGMDVDIKTLNEIRFMKEQIAQLGRKLENLCET